MSTDPATTNPTMTELFGDVIHAYTRAMALEDGTLVDVSEAAAEAGIRYPVAMTRAAWADLVEWNADNMAFQDEPGRLWDVIYTLRTYMRGASGDRINAAVIRIPNKPRNTRPVTARFWAQVGPGDNAEPVITIMLHGED